MSLYKTVIQLTSYFQCVSGIIYILGLIFSSIILLSCRQEENLKYYWVRFQSREYKKADTTYLTEFDKSQSGDTLKYSYQTKSGGVKFFIVNFKDSALTISHPRDGLVHPNDSVVFMRNFYDTTIIFNRDTFRVKEFIRNEFVTDGASIHYYTPTFGLYAGHSNTWAGITFLQTNDTTVNKQIYSLIKATVPKFFIRDTLEKILK